MTHFDILLYDNIDRIAVIPDMIYQKYYIVIQNLNGEILTIEPHPCYYDRYIGESLTYVVDAIKEIKQNNEISSNMPYQGSKAYIFVSYAQRDREYVMPIIRRLQKDGYRVWYDEGIDPGTEWDANIAEHVVKCGCFISMISKAYIESDNCKDELNYARDKNKNRILIYLEDVILPDGMQMR